VIDIAWQEGQLTSATIYSKRGGPCKVQTQVALRVQLDGRAVHANKEETATIQFPTESGKSYILAAKVTARAAR
jgi:hypothetical protein